MWLPSALRACYKYVRAISAKECGRPLVIVHGDTLSTLASAFAGRLAGGKVVHLESGLTSKKLFDPFPEEILRRLTFRLTRYAICPNNEAAGRMLRYRCDEIVDTGQNTLLDCVRYALHVVGTQLARSEESYFVVSIHRVQNIYSESKLSGIVEEILELSRIAPVYFVLHPSTEKRLAKAGLRKVLSDTTGVILKPRMPYTQFISLLASARAVLSDGGSNQEELSYLGVPTILFRDRSERPEGLGRNVILRSMIEGKLNAYIESGRLEDLRNPRQLHEEVQPSRRAVEALARWCSDISC
jgi:UDP-N-acetylglucosamine 2-epimerase (non-hydrolysing)